MLPRNFPKFGGFQVNLTAKLGGIELEIKVDQPGFGFQRNILAFKEALLRCLGWIIPFAGFIANTFFGNQFDRWLEEVDVEP